MVRGQQQEISLLQLATPTMCLLVRVGDMGEALPAKLTKLLEAEAPLKVGRGLKADVAALRRRFGCNVGGATELQGRENLKSLARSVGGLSPPPEKGWMTNWAARELDDDKLRYAAFDAFAAASIFAAEPEGRPLGPGPTKKRRPRKTRSRSAMKRR